MRPSVRSPVREPVPMTFLGRLLAVLLLAAAGIGTVLAQEGDPTDPPGRVGSISLLAGPVTLVDLQTGSREEAVLNWPITAGWRLETGRGGRAEVRIGSTAVRLDGDSTVDFARLDDHFVQVAVLRGAAALRLRDRDIVTELEVLTQRERISFDEVGRYRIDVDAVPGQTAVTAFAGRARIASGSNTFLVATGQRGEVTAPPLTRFQLTPASPDRFDDWVAARDARDDAVRSAAYVSREATGVEILDDYGDWRTVADYGPVWFPRTVAPGWAPYRYGRWAWIEPWGWTWIDEAPWGFAPFHYGRWVVVGSVWGWMPGVIVPRPVYAPALVAWFGTPGISVTIGGPIGWFPLGPREVYVPAFRHSPRYLRVVNVQHVTNVNQITIVQTPRYVHRHPDRSTWVLPDRFGRPEPVQRGVRPPPSEWRQYIAQPQPPANVPGTKRRQTSDFAAPPATARPARNSEAATPVRPPAVVPRPAETPGPDRAQPATPTVQPPPPRSRVETPASGSERRFAPRPPSTSETPSIPGAAPAPAERPRTRDLAPMPARPPATEPTAPRGRGETGVPAREIAPQPAPVRPPAVESPPTRGRGEPGFVPRETRRAEPRVAPPPAAPTPRVAPPHPGNGAARETARPQPAPPPTRIERGDDRPTDRPIDRPTGRSPRESLR